MALTVLNSSIGISEIGATLSGRDVNTADSRGVLVTAGSGGLDIGDRANGSLHLSFDRLAEIKFGGAARKLGFAEHVVECRLANFSTGTNATYRTYMPVKGVLTAVKRAFLAAPDANVSVDVQIAGASVLNTNTETEVGLTANALTAHTLCTNATLLAFDAGAVVDIIHTVGTLGSGGTVPKYYLCYDNN